MNAHTIPANFAGDGWTPEREAALPVLWSRGRSASQIAYILGGGLSRGAVIGKICRLGLQRGPAARRAAQRKGGTAVAASLRSRVPAKAKVQVPKPVQPPVATPTGEPPSLKLDLMSRRNDQCHYPHGDPRETLTYCGHPVPEGSPVPYCPYHRRLMYVAPQKRQARADGGDYRPKPGRGW